MGEDLRGVLRTAKARETFEFRRATPDPALQGFVEVFWYVAWDLRGQEPYVQEVLPYPAVNVTFKRGRSRVAGVTRGKFTELLEDVHKVFGIRFRPGGFRSLLGAPVSTITNRFLPLTQVFGPEALDWERAMLAATEIDDMARLAKQFLLPRLPREPDPSVEQATRAVALIAEDPTLTRVEEVARRLGTHPRSLQRLFQEYVGVGPKWVIRLHRLQEATNRASQGPEIDWATLAAELGYADQAHLVREFRQIVGLAPTAYTRSL